MLKNLNLPIEQLLLLSRQDQETILNEQDPELATTKSMNHHILPFVFKQNTTNISLWYFINFKFSNQYAQILFKNKFIFVYENRHILELDLTTGTLTHLLQINPSDIFCQFTSHGKLVLFNLMTKMYFCRRIPSLDAKETPLTLPLKIGWSTPRLPLAEYLGPRNSVHFFELSKKHLTYMPERVLYGKAKQTNERVENFIMNSATLLTLK